MRPDWPVLIRQIIAAKDCSLKEAAAIPGVRVNTLVRWTLKTKQRRTPNFEHGWALVQAYKEIVGKEIPQR